MFHMTQGEARIAANRVLPEQADTHVDDYTDVRPLLGQTMQEAIARLEAFKRAQSEGN